MHPKKPSTAALPRLRPFAPMERVSPYRPMSPGHPGHRQWRPRPECIRGRAPPGGVATASSGIRSASSASGPNPAACATILPSWQSTGGERHAIPVPGPDPGDVRQPLPVRLSGREAPVGQAAGCGSRLDPAGTVPAPFGVFCQVVIGQCGVSFPSEKAVGFSPVRNWPVIARVLLFHCIRA